MNERFLCKAKRLDNREWETGWYFRSSSDEDCIITDHNDIYDTLLNNANAIDPKTLCQCTGLKDKNGVLIFEGDIVKQEVIRRSSSNWWQTTNKHHGGGYFVEAYVKSYGYETKFERYGLELTEKGKQQRKDIAKPIGKETREQCVDCLNWRVEKLEVIGNIHDKE